jgi:hypothetical protein
MTVIKAVFGLFEMQMEGMPGHPIELDQSALGIAPEIQPTPCQRSSFLIAPYLLKPCDSMSKCCLTLA